MAMRVGINAFGRIGATCLRAALDRAEAGIQDAHMVAINDIASPATLAHLLAYDSTFGRIGRDVAHTVVIFGHGPRRRRLTHPDGDRCRRSPVSSSAPGTTSAKHGADRPPRCPDSPWAPSPNRWTLEVPRGLEETPDDGHRAPPTLGPHLARAKK
ncbi:glyceraldehyde 3-phosphate dehydrogenase NAD-binding domain-containing protein [Streptomyces canus]|uniref:glyceraldehyde 3-phosphate dehydrogenase NAD-binding domain-containing protein n=1 Tax=Streptomyces canus TaxID=58343 RepID=UPI003250768C